MLSHCSSSSTIPLITLSVHLLPAWTPPSHLYTTEKKIRKKKPLCPPHEPGDKFNSALILNVSDDTGSPRAQCEIRAPV